MTVIKISADQSNWIGLSVQEDFSKFCHHETKTYDKNVREPIFHCWFQGPLATCMENMAKNVSSFESPF